MKEWTPAQVAAGVYGVYQDTVSLYPTVQYFDWLPYGAPTTVMYTADDQPNLEDVFGLIECGITPTEALIHDLLATVEDNKLMGTQEAGVHLG